MSNVLLQKKVNLIFLIIYLFMYSILLSIIIVLDADTLVYPLIEFPPFEIHQDSHTTNLLMSNAEPGSSMHLATGYFNIPDIYTETIFHKSLANFNILFSHPMANSFQKAKGPAGFIPNAYSFLTNSFYSKIKTLKLHERITCFEYQRSGWTFHSKGLWYTPKNYEFPVLTTVGSSNYGIYTFLHF